MSFERLVVPGLACSSHWHHDHWHHDRHTLRMMFVRAACFLFIPFAVCSPGLFTRCDRDRVTVTGCRLSANPGLAGSQVIGFTAHLSETWPTKLTDPIVLGNMAHSAIKV